MAILLLKALGLPEDTPATALADLNKRLTCRCGHPDYRKPLDFGTLIRHFICENEWYERMVGDKNKSSLAKIGVVLQNDHDLSNSDSCVTLLPSDTICENQANKDADETTSTEHHKPSKYCVYCWRLVPSLISPLRSDAEVEYHMKGKHQKEACEGDAICHEELIKLHPRPSYWQYVYRSANIVIRNQGCVRCRIALCVRSSHST